MIDYTLFAFNKEPDWSRLTELVPRCTFFGYDVQDSPLFLASIFDPKLSRGRPDSYPLTMACRVRPNHELSVSTQSAATTVEQLADSLSSNSLAGFSNRIRLCATVSDLVDLPTFFMNSADEFIDSACFAESGEIKSFGVTLDVSDGSLILALSKGKYTCIVHSYGPTATRDIILKKHKELEPKTDGSKYFQLFYWPNQLWPKTFGPKEAITLDTSDPLYDIDSKAKEIVFFNGRNKSNKITRSK